MSLRDQSVLQVLVGDGFGLVSGFPAAYYQCHWVVVYPLVALAVGHERLQGGDPGVPGGGLRRPPPLLKGIEQPGESRVGRREAPMPRDSATAESAWRYARRVLADSCLSEKNASTADRNRGVPR